MVTAGVVAMVIAACAAGDDTDAERSVADAPVPPAGSEPVTSPPATAFATLPPPPTTSPPPSAASTPATVPNATGAAPDRPLAGPGEASTGHPDDRADASSSTVANDPPAEEPAGDDGAPSDPTDVDFVTDEPSFDIGPQVDIDVQLARFPIDDAGQGGVAGPPADPDDAAADGAGADPGDAATGWAAVDRYLAATLIRPGNTAAGVAVSIGGDIVHTAAFGTRDPSTGDPAEPGDRFRIASISKPITAIVAMRLVRNGVVGLDEPIGDVLAGHVGLDAVSGGARGLTLRSLLTHRSGFGKFDTTFFRGGADDCVEAARTGLARGSGGGGYVYSNMNYCLAGLLIEAVTGETYERAVYTHLLTPLGISGMRLPPTVDPGPGEIQHTTTPGRNYMETLGAAGAWIASPAELVTILDALDLSTPGFKPLDQDGVFSMVVPPGGSYGQRGYGLGLISYGDGRFGHTGTIESTHAMLLNRGDGVTWAITVAGEWPSESTALERIMNDAFEAGGFVDAG